jgi:hypothetical protein
MTENEELANELEPYFRSGNDVPVERATIPAELAGRILAALRAIPAAVTSREVQFLKDLSERVGMPGQADLERQLSDMKKILAATEDERNRLLSTRDGQGGMMDKPHGPNSEVVAWIATSEKGSVIHFSKADGWKVEIAQTERVTPATNSPTAKEPK